MGKKKKNTSVTPTSTSTNISPMSSQAIKKPQQQKNKTALKNLKRLQSAIVKHQGSSSSTVPLKSRPNTGTTHPTIAASSKKKPLVKKSFADETKERLQSAHFRYLNEQLYTTTSYQAWELFQEDPHSFDIYHKGFQNQVAKWPVNPLDLIISDLRKKPKEWVIADFGCGEARLALNLPDHTVHSFDLVAANERVTACDMAHVPLANRIVDVAVFCLSLMGQNLQEFLTEANRVLKIGGFLYLAEVQSRCPDVEAFLRSTEKFGFRLQKETPKQIEAQKQNSRFFFFARFTKISNISPKATLPRMQLKPCLYKKR